MKRNARRVKTPCGFVIISPNLAGGLQAGSQSVPGIDEVFPYSRRVSFGCMLFDPAINGRSLSGEKNVLLNTLCIIWSHVLRGVLSPRCVSG